MKVLSIVGARPQFVKAFPVSCALRTAHEEVLVHTGQHYDDELSGVFFRQLEIPAPDHHLGVGSATHAVQTARIMERLDPVVEAEAPDVVLVYGDTNSTLAGALVAAKRRVSLAHVEAGLRSYNRAMAEEVNRVLTDHAADLLLAPTEEAVSNLAAEGLTDGVVLTGDVMVDALELVQSHVGEASQARTDLGFEPGGYLLLTVHRAENTDDNARLTSIIEGLSTPTRPVVFPCHPRTRGSLERADLWERVLDRFEVIEPVGYPEFVSLLAGAERVVTDSGGVQKEAFLLDTPCVTLREETEWVETVRAGWNVLVGAEPEQIRQALDRPFDLADKPSPFGDGEAADRVRRALEERIQRRTSTPAAE